MFWLEDVKKTNLFIIFFLTLYVVVSAGCSENELPAGIMGGAFKLEDKNAQDKILSIMGNSNIPYEVDHDGFIHYLLKNQAQINTIKRNVIYGSMLSENILETAIINNKSRDKYAYHLKKENISFRIYSYNGNIHLEWNQKDGPKVDIIRQNIEMEEYLEIKKQLN